MDPMSEATVSSKTKTAKPTASFAEPAAFTSSFGKFEMPKFEMPKFDMPSMEVPAAFRDLAEKGIAQAKGNYEKIKSVAEDTTDMLEDTYSTASKGMSEYGLKVIEVSRSNTNASFDFATQLFGVKSFSDMVELTTTHARKQFEAFTAQGKELTSMAQQVATKTAEPIKDSVSKAFNKAA
jgi:phasin